MTHSCFLARTDADSGLTGQITLQPNRQAAPAGSRDVVIKGELVGLRALTQKESAAVTRGEEEEEVKIYC